MAAIGNGDFPAQGDFRAAVATLHRHGCQGAQGVRRGNGSRCGLHPAGCGCQGLPQLGKNLVFQGGEPVLGGKYLVFQFFQLLGDVAFTVGKGLLADIVCGHLIHKGLGNLDVVAENPVEAHPQGADAGLLPLAGFDSRNGAGAALHNVPEPVRIHVCPLADNAALPDGQGRVVHDGVFNHGGAVVQGVYSGHQFFNKGCVQPFKLLPYGRQSAKPPGKA